MTYASDVPTMAAKHSHNDLPSLYDSGTPHTHISSRVPHVPT